MEQIWKGGHLGATSFGVHYTIKGLHCRASPVTEYLVFTSSYHMQPRLKSLPSSLYLHVTYYVVDSDFEPSHDYPILLVTVVVAETVANSTLPSRVAERLRSNSVDKVEVKV